MMIEEKEEDEEAAAEDMIITNDREWEKNWAAEAINRRNIGVGVCVSALVTFKKFHLNDGKHGCRMSVRITKTFTLEDESKCVYI